MTARYPLRVTHFFLGVVCLLFLFETTAATSYGGSRINDTTKESTTCSPQPLEERLWEALMYFGTTIETFSRGFGLGFGGRMMKFVWENKDENTDNLMERMKVCSVSGMALAAVVHGAALFIPADWRLKWFGA
ncbi:expressed unknown protein [Seminavis robusta]|uniref:Uncharacterized protein n=1 Tax=Seminavis robusta TaxID=568900 RepID=A0A9N8HDZ1_9STRA|nr:expressed unknown protein [Seminavis robusta]|eukprot:Sro448_g145170.1 n/a (133) ;mRNA; r:43434-43832